MPLSPAYQAGGYGGVEINSIEFHTYIALAPQIMPSCSPEVLQILADFISHFVTSISTQQGSPKSSIHDLIIERF